MRECMNEKKGGAVSEPRIEIKKTKKHDAESVKRQ
jgi:hypothetical protein